METNKTDEPTNSGVEDVRASEHNARLSFVDTLACDYTPISGRCSRRNQAREVEGVPALGRLPALRSHGSYVDNTIAQVRTHVKVFPPARLRAAGFSSPAWKADSYPHFTNGFCEMAYQAKSYGRVYHNLYHLVPLYKRAKKDVGKNQTFR